MCLIIHRPKSATIPPDYLANASRVNPDGWGVMWQSKGTIKITQGMGPGLDKAVQAAGHHPCAVHLRYATHGKKNVANCHPFPILKGAYAIMHNGVINTVPIVKEDRSDSWHWANHVLAPLLAACPGLYDDPGFPGWLGQVVGTGNKLLLLRAADGKVLFVNRELGVERDGLWLSNAYSVQPPVVTAWPKTWVGSRHRDVNFFADEELEDVPAENLEAIAGGHLRDEWPALTIPDDAWEAIGMTEEELEDFARADPAGAAEVMFEALAWLKDAYA